MSNAGCWEPHIAVHVNSELYVIVYSVWFYSILYLVMQLITWTVEWDLHNLGLLQLLQLLVTGCEVLAGEVQRALPVTASFELEACEQFVTTWWPLCELALSVCCKMQCRTRGLTVWYTICCRRSFWVLSAFLHPFTVLHLICQTTLMEVLKDCFF